MAVARKKVSRPARAPQAGWTRWRRPLIVTGAVALVLLLAIRFVASPVVTGMVNRRLADLPEYSGRVGRITLALWRGTVEAHDFSLWPRGHEQEGPIVQVRQATLSPAWLRLFRGQIGGSARVDGADILLLNDDPVGEPEKSEEEKERAKQERLAKVRRWQSTLQGAFPLELSRLEIANSRVRFRDLSVEPQPEMAIDRLGLVLTGLGREPTSADDLPAAARLEGVMTGNGRLRATVQADPLAKQPRFDARLELQELALPAVKNFMRAYAKIDVTAGTFEVFMEVTARDGAYQGYVKPFFRDLEFEPVRDENQNVVERLATGAAAAVTSLLKNEDDKIATRAPFEGNFADNEVDVWTTIENLLRNAFIQSLQEGLEGQRPAA